MALGCGDGVLAIGRLADEIATVLGGALVSKLH